MNTHDVEAVVKATALIALLIGPATALFTLGQVANGIIPTAPEYLLWYSVGTIAAMTVAAVAPLFSPPTT